MNEPVNGNFGQQGQQQEKVVLNLGDISTVLQIIDVCSQRGGFQGQELAGVGMLRNKLEAYLRQNAPQPDNSVADNAVDVAPAPEGSAPLADKVID